MNNPTPPIPDNGWRERLEEKIRRVWKTGEHMVDEHHFVDYMLDLYQQELYTAIEEERARSNKIVDETRLLLTALDTQQKNPYEPLSYALTRNPLETFDRIVAKHCPDKETAE